MIQRFAIIFVLFTALMMIACGSSADPVVETANTLMQTDGVGDATITNIVEGDPATRGADELYCVETDATRTDNGLPYLLVVWNDGSGWQAETLFEGYYDWDLQGCPR